MSKELFEDNFFDDFFGEKSEEENISTKNAKESVLSSAKETKRKSARGPRVKLTETELCSSKGIYELLKVFEHYKPNYSKDPYENLRDMMNKIELWAHQLHPKLKFEDFIQRVESLSCKKRIKVEMERIRLNMAKNEDQNEEIKNNDTGDTNNFSKSKEDVNDLSRTEDVVNDFPRTSENADNLSRIDKNRFKVSRDSNGSLSSFSDIIMDDDNIIVDTQPISNNSGPLATVDNELDEDDALNFIFSNK
ncbi:unnamed protein product [Dracunculus medinensis]|uniref:TIMELESS-interacting protein n=1 Tax=Dracunculus medinensis TaxID=318479 RepID=A0A0N4U7E9_DRAME|nr:unnamed protein product [Dracunculus medinensis]